MRVPGVSGSHLLVLALVVLHGGQVGQVALQSLDALLLLSVLLRLFLTLLLQVVDVLVPSADLDTRGTAHVKEG